MGGLYFSRAFTAKEKDKSFTAGGAESAGGAGKAKEKYLSRNLGLTQ